MDVGVTVAKNKKFHEKGSFKNHNFFNIYGVQQ